MSRILGYMRKWAFDGETPVKERRENGRLAWPFRFKLRPITEHKCLADDIELVNKEEIDRLTRELAEAKARAVPSWTDTKFALGEWLKKKDLFDDPKAVFATAAWKACWDFMMLSARPESPPNGLPNKDSENE